jgi:hypothetical protein
MTPSLKGGRLGPEFWWAPRARILQIRASISASSNSIEMVRSGQLGPGYIHIVTSRRQSGWMRRQMKVHRRSTPVNSFCSSCQTTSHRGCGLRMYHWAPPYPQLGWGMRWLLVDTGSGASTLFLKKSILSPTQPEGWTSKARSTDRLPTQIRQRCPHYPTLPLPRPSPAIAERGRNSSTNQSGAQCNTPTVS